MARVGVAFAVIVCALFGTASAQHASIAVDPQGGAAAFPHRMRTDRTLSQSGEEIEGVSDEIQEHKPNAGGKAIFSRQSPGRSANGVVISEEYKDEDNVDVQLIKEVGEDEELDNDEVEEDMNNGDVQLIKDDDGDVEFGEYDGDEQLIEAPLCATNEQVYNHECVVCPAGRYSSGEHDASGPNTSCTATLCQFNERVAGNTCVTCPGGQTTSYQHDASGPDTTCEALVCSASTLNSDASCVVADSTKPIYDTDMASKACTTSPCTATECCKACGAKTHKKRCTKTVGCKWVGKKTGVCIAAR